MDKVEQKPGAKRLGMWVVCSIVIVAGVLVILFEPTQVLLGTIRGDAFFQSRPTRYWTRALQSGPTQQAEAMTQLQQGGKAGVPVLAAILSDKSVDPALRCDAAEILAKLGPDASESGPVMVATLNDADPHVQAVCVAGLPKVGVSAETAVPLLMGLLKSEHSVVSARALSTYKAAAVSSVPILIELLQDRTRKPEVRANAARTIGKIGPGSISAVPALIGEMGDADASIREHCAEALGDIGPQAAADGIPPLLKVLTDVNTRVRRDAVRSLGNFGEAAKSTLPEIRKLLNDPETIVREAARNAFKAVAPEEPLPPAAPEPAKKATGDTPAATNVPK